MNQLCEIINLYWSFYCCRCSRLDSSKSPPSGSTARLDQHMNRSIPAGGKPWMARGISALTAPARLRLRWWPAFPETTCWGERASCVRMVPTPSPRRRWTLPRLPPPRVVQRLTKRKLRPTLRHRRTAEVGVRWKACVGISFPCDL